jgi:hypothetical protein
MKLRLGGPSGPTRNLLLIDRSGEFFRDVLDSSQELAALEIARRSDHFALLVSGPMLYSDQVQAKTRSNALALIRRCVEGGVLGADSRVDILVTKWDVVNTLFPATAEAVIAEFSADLKRAYGEKLKRLRISPIAARPHPGSSMPMLWGVEELLRSWVEDMPAVLDRKPTPGPWPRDTRDMFDLYALRHTPELFGERL